MTSSNKFAQRPDLPVRPTPRAHESVDLPAADTLSEPTIEGSPAAAADKVASVSVEGRPADGDAKSGPRTLLREVAWTIALVLIATIGVGAWFGWVAGLAALGIGCAAILLNPAIGAALFRVGDRAEVVERDRR